jgi:hypothetical protein
MHADQGNPLAAFKAWAAKHKKPYVNDVKVNPAIAWLASPQLI